MPGGGDPRDSATERTPPTPRRGRPGRAARVKWCGKSAPRRRQRRWQGKPHREQDQVGAAGAVASGKSAGHAPGGPSRRRPGRLHEARGNERPRGMAATVGRAACRRSACGTEPGLHAVWHLPRPLCRERVCHYVKCDGRGPNIGRSTVARLWHTDAASQRQQERCRAHRLGVESSCARAWQYPVCPGGYHLMCMSPGRAMTPGQSVSVTLRLASGETVSTLSGCAARAENSSLQNQRSSRANKPGGCWSSTRRRRSAVVPAISGVVEASEATIRRAAPDPSKT